MIDDAYRRARVTVNMVARTKRLVKATAKKLALARAPKSPSRVRNSKKPPRESAPALVGSDLVGAIVEKWFKPEWFKGKVVRYNEEHKWYWVEYEDGDEEEMNLRELREVLIWVPGQPKLDEHDDLDVGFRLVGFEVLKQFGEDEIRGGRGWVRQEDRVVQGGVRGRRSGGDGPRGAAEDHQAGIAPGEHRGGLEARQARPCARGACQTRGEETREQPVAEVNV